MKESLELRARNTLCLALDRPESFGDAAKTLVKFENKVGVVKFNMAFVKYHAGILELACDLGYSVWIDLKFHDTPDTVRDEIMALVDMAAVEFATIHILGCSEMIKKAVSAAGLSLNILGITVLTSITQKQFNEELLIQGTIQDYVVHLARFGQNSGLDGIVCSGIDASYVRVACGLDFFIATPGIRFSGEQEDDQKMVITPKQAVLNGSNLVVMGRDLLNGGDAAVDRALDEIAEAITEIEEV